MSACLMNSARIRDGTPKQEALAQVRRTVEALAAGGTHVARVLTVVYFLFFLLMPWYTARDKTKPVPARTT